MSSNVVLCAPVRTPIGAYGGTLKDMAAPALGSIAIAETVKRAGVGIDTIDAVVLGQVVQAGAKMNPARQAAIGAKLPDSVPALTVNRVCGSGAQAIASAAQEIMLGFSHAVVAGGMENMDQAPYLIEKGRWGYRMGDGKLVDAMLHDGLNDAFCNQHSGWVTEDLVSQFQITRDAQDAWAVRSQQNFSAAQAAGRFEEEIVAVEIPSRKGPIIFGKDEQNRPDTSLESLARLKPAFRPEGTITAGNAPGLNSGAAAMIVASEDWADRNGVTPLGRLVAFGVGAVAPGLFGLGPVPAVRQALDRAGWSVSDLERVEINEAFAAIAIAVTHELGLAEDIVNVEGGAIAHGHPIGATGAVLTTRLLHALKREGLKRGLVTLCIGGGQGVALALEVI
ncbi:acetyl-CoA C-acyltransferase [Sphingobium yanoikuyae]|uniref:Acetyl-CoA C-acyltransferase n=2 Tax=Sphingobium TaxID=165695 RepID=A0A6P1GGA0_SPHYA|nr:MULTISPECIES: acetyl-CoA C-acetyltransferase [Sphingobium]PHP21622.1 acetyl-CoA acetyltransferase [Sphingobium sp. IP1]QHD66671.1 acetyl-CoA C-acyltransferase [Sphingobium yanoikuyae]